MSLFFLPSGDLELFGGGQCIVPALRVGTSHKREARIDVQNFEASNSIRAEIASASRFCTVQLYHRIRNVLCSFSARGRTEVDWNCALYIVDGD